MAEVLMCILCSKYPYLYSIYLVGVCKRTPMTVCMVCQVTYFLNNLSVLFLDYVF